VVIIAAVVNIATDVCAALFAVAFQAKTKFMRLSSRVRAS
jgi:hypothetical protein